MFAVQALTGYFIVCPSSFSSTYGAWVQLQQLGGSQELVILTSNMRATRPSTPFPTERIPDMGIMTQPGRVYFRLISEVLDQSSMFKQHSKLSVASCLAFFDPLTVGLRTLTRALRHWCNQLWQFLEDSSRCFNFQLVTTSDLRYRPKGRSYSFGMDTSPSVDER
ncbi:hypothetical protein C8J56DRAFT_899349 [Mycena floridula]|nr:hypothetical protein C8J56DRAFT_899349 [Mycena floridula]